MLRILFIGNYPNPTDKNLYVFFKNLIHAISDCGVECYVISPVSITKYKGNIKKIPKESIEHTKSGNEIKVFYPRFVSASSKQIFKFNTMQITHKNYLRTALKTAKRINKKFDCTYGHFFLSGGLAAVHIGRKFGIPSFIAYGESSFETQIRKIYALKEKDIDGLTGIVSVSSKNTDELKNEDLLKNIPVKTFPNAVDMSLFKEYDKKQSRKDFNIPEKAFTVGFVGSFGNRKGCMRVLEACKDIDGVNLAFAGYGEEKPTGENVVFCDSVEHDDIGKFLSCLDVFSLPTLNEGCCNAVLEAMASGTAIISSDLPFNYDVLTSENSIMVDPLSISDIHNAVEKLKNDTELRNKISNKAKTDSQKFTIEKRAENIICFIKDLLK